ncbi:MAG: PKD domain-containing protein [Solirubrobacteraceae bacterium]|nr:PKD domain-containing protein [Solirubrobacteraceae bacterium]
MSTRIATATVTTLSAAAVVSAPALAGNFAGDPIAGPSTEIQRLSDLDMARDGTGALAFISNEGGEPRAFVSRFVAGAFIGAERVDAGIPAGVTAAAVAATNGGRVSAVFSAGGVVYGVVKPNGAQPWSAPTPIGNGTAPSLAMSLTGTAYASFTNNGDINVARLDRTTNGWTAVAGAFDVDPAREAGTGSKRSKVSISADGVGIVVWGEDGADGRTHVYARKVFGANASTRPQDLTANDIEGRPAGNADMPDVDAEDDSSYAWVVFRQAIADANGVTRLRTVARRQRGTEFDPPVPVDSFGVPADEDTAAPRIDLNGRGEGIASLSGAGTNQPIASLLQADLFARGQRYGTAGAQTSAAVGAVADNSDGLLAWVQSPGADAPSVRVRPFDKFVAQPEVVLSKPEYGPVDPTRGFEAVADRAGSGVVAWVQTSATLPGARSIVAGYLDKSPRAFNGYTSTKYRSASRPKLAWGEAVDLWGPITYRVLIDGVQVTELAGRTGWTPVQPIPDGVHRWQVQAVDRRGQVTNSRVRLLRVDATPPTLTAKVSGVRKAARPLKLTFKAADVQNPKASGLARVRIDWGDGTTTTTKSFKGTVTHRYRRGSYTLRVSATDKAGAATVVTRSLRIGKR